MANSSRGQSSNSKYEASFFNLNNTMNSPSSLLTIAAQRNEKVSGITHPWMYLGAMFSTFCWHVEDLGVNSLNYNHQGGAKTWYVVPGKYKEKFDAYIRQKYCLNMHKQGLLERITFMVDPLELLAEGIPVHKTYQRPKDYICTFHKAYHCGFSQGYNIGEAVNFISPLSIEVMKEAELLKKQSPQKAPNVFPIDWIIYENYQRIGQFSSYRDKL
jgi:histone demethylase JARID1